MDSSSHKANVTIKVFDLLYHLRIKFSETNQIKAHNKNIDNYNVVTSVN